MILAIILAIVVFVVSLILCLDEGDGIVASTIVTLIFSTVIGLLSSLLFLIPNTFIPKEEKEYSSVSHKIVALKDTKESKGSFILGSGYIDEELYYYYFEETSEGLKKRKLRASDCYIKYDDNPRVIEYTHTGYKKAYHYIYATPEVIHVTYYVIYVPKGSITNEFKVDLE